MARPRTHDEALRLRLLDRAGELLSTEGAKALSLRKLAADAGTSTTAVYSLFGGKPGLVNALYAEGFKRFGARMRAVPRSGDAVEDLVRLGLAYRQSALADPHLYSIMFTKAVLGFEPGAEATELGRRTLSPLVEVVRAGIESGQFAPVAAETIAVGAWGIVHGLVSLELNGNLPPAFDMGASYEAALRAQARGWGQ
ncbi:TetR/AcrR family transcriptional regulator [Amycolatopsis acidiphila]|uniref:TetR/AcrR family transcriptional regulator n=1 Tax=Amycolatopsis acidiphila TaxID=715473 RepID=A0A557ZMW4_9PSEU|nr:TetR/AcrR family transcriptional regulator [Amycolatopsis acidiphila]TVT13367.1 TetR/AcrR family transcriptional regulator [Amycolatopsis acidiphila]UIJ60847.1 TetR/AcrR family transcriptional regulator [Amycolatopsis acidiphila]GHG94305.1 TetR family transcriptional regulator [Amycolatopsis acidiphila]